MIPTVAQTPVDAERLAFIEHLARGVQAVAGNALVAMTGGSALRLCHNLPRPSFDLDLDVSTRKNWLRTVQRVADQSPWRSVVEVDQKQGGHGYIRITARPDGLPPWQTKVDPRVCDGTARSLLVRADCETVNGIVCDESIRDTLSAQPRQRASRVDVGRPSNGTVSAYSVRYATDDAALSSSPWPEWNVIAGTGTTTIRHVVPNLANGTRYYFQIQALADDRSSGPSNTAITQQDA